MAAVEEVLKAADCFEVLGMEPKLATCTHPQDRLRRCTNCESDFKQAKKVRQLQVHPDKNPGETQAADAFKQVMHAWSQVSEAGERQTYLANLSTRATLELQKATALASMRAAASSAAAEPAASSAEVPAAAPKVLHVPGDYSVHIFTKHVRAQLDVGLSRNFPFRSAADREAAIQSAKDFLAKVHDFTNAFDACPNAAARKAFLEPFKIKPLNTKGATREAFHKACCGKSCSYFENALAEKQPDEVAAQQQAMGADSVGGMDIHGSFFNKPELKPPKHPSRPVYLHPGAFTAFRKAASGRDSHGVLLGQKRTSLGSPTSTFPARRILSPRQPARPYWRKELKGMFGLARSAPSTWACRLHPTKRTLIMPSNVASSTRDFHIFLSRSAMAVWPPEIGRVGSCTPPLRRCKFIYAEAWARISISWIWLLSR